MKIIDLTQTITDQMQVYPGDTPPLLKQTCTLEKNHYTNHTLTIGMHTGTHIDGPWHMVNSPCLVSDLPITQFMGKACIIDISREKIFNDTQLIKEKKQHCDIILFHTGYGKLFGSEQYLTNYPLIGNNAAEEIAASGIKLIGTDTLSPDIVPHLTHKALLSKGVLIAENLANLHLLLNETFFQVIALPIKIAADSAPARIVAILDS